MSDNDPRDEALTDEEIAEAQGGEIGEGDEGVSRDCFGEEARDEGVGRLFQQEG